MIIVKPVPADAFTSVRDNDGISSTTAGWLHDCGAFVYSPTQPARCGVCWSALRNGQAHNGSWQQVYTAKEAS
ncbi:hypothetical protein PWY87_29920 [Kribbella solani]|uniref:hypothetical protein n=1 Tax=Kribbella solani TaxID=236067 RepID=UPI0029A65CAF|nr:hypothetical protein [Kribbella solani]MDX3005933.1 hypothetical protein [Kribbella solani]